jgi:hypothetical protein
VPDGTAVELLAECLLDRDVDVMFDAANALARIASAPAIEALVVAALDEHRAMARRVAAVSALGDVVGITPRGVEALRGLAAAADPWLQAVAKQALVHLKLA